MSKAPIKEVTLDTFGVYKKHSNGQRFHDLDVVACMIAASFAALKQNANEADCLRIVEEGMKQIGWKQ